MYEEGVDVEFVPGNTEIYLFSFQCFWVLSENCVVVWRSWWMMGLWTCQIRAACSSSGRAVWQEHVGLRLDLKCKILEPFPYQRYETTYHCTYPSHGTNVWAGTAENFTTRLREKVWLSSKELHADKRDPLPPTSNTSFASQRSFM